MPGNDGNSIGSWQKAKKGDGSTVAFSLKIKIQDSERIVMQLEYEVWYDINRGILG